ncbi:glycerol ethanol, ferric requiring protein [Saitozyma podzolica]|uniref:Chloride channel protein n=1 Tax=Saitozyma podzolica TaxID=1890683 RepID=A0A427YHV0_9TREE|nr:glycerol ethanol, ferric requiring protein [Saitozyma podzolica]
MSYPPRGSGGAAQLDVENPLMGHRDVEDGKEEEEVEEEIEQVRRYEDFTTVDWIEDALHERYARAQAPPKPNSLTARLDMLEGAPGYVWRGLRDALEEGQSWVVITLVGIAIGMSAALMSVITVWLSDMKMGYCKTGWWLSQKYCCLELGDEGEGCAEWSNWGGVEPFRWFAYILFAATFSFSAAFIVRSFAPYAAGSGISEIKCILGGFIIKGFLGFETFLIKALTLPLAIASGLSIGREGPSVHVACAAGNVIGRMFSRYDRSQLKMREIVTASSAAGVAVAFGSPIGGVLFSIEEMNQVFSNRTMWQSFVCALVATFTLAVSYDRDWHYFEIPAYVVIGIFGGLYGAFVIKFNLQMAAFRRKHLANHGVAEAVTLATITAFIGYLNRFLRIDMTESMEILTSAQWRMVNSLLLAVVVRTALVVVSYGCKVPCGIFVPSMAVGAMFGRMVGILVKALHTAYPTAPWFAMCAPDAPCITPGTYAFLGAAAALGLTVTVVVIMFELTGALTYLLPVMITLLVTKAVSNQFGGGGMADQVIKFNGFPFLEQESKEDEDAFFQPIANVMKKDLAVMFASGVPLQTISEIVQSTNYQGFPVVRSEEDRTIIGFVRKSELRYALERARRTRNIASNATCTFLHSSDDTGATDGLVAGPDIVIPGRQASHSRSQGGPRNSGVEAEQVDFGQYVDQTPLIVSPKMPLEIVMQLFRRMGPRVILVATEGQLVGLVTVKDVLRHEARHEARHARHGKRSAGPAGLDSPSAGSPRSPRSLPAHMRQAGATHGRTDSAQSQSSNGWAESWAAVEEGESSGNGLEIALEEGLGWAQARVNQALRLFRGRLNWSGSGSARRQPQGHDAAYEFELAEAEDRPR